MIEAFAAPLRIAPARSPRAAAARSAVPIAAISSVSGGRL